MSEIQDYQYVSIDHNQKALINALCAVIPAGNSLRFDPFEEYGDNAPVVSITVDIDNILQLKLNAYDDFFLDEDELLRNLNIRQLPSELSSVAFELAFEPYLRRLSELIGHELKFEAGYEEKLASKYRIFFSLKHHERWLLFSVDIPDESAVHKLVELLGQLPSIQDEALSRHLSCCFRFDLGQVTINGAELNQLHCGDILLPDCNYLSHEELCVRLHQQVLHFKFKDAVATYQGYSSLVEHNQDFNMSEENGNGEAGLAAEEQSSLQEGINQDDLQFEVAFELDRQLLDYAEVMALKRGTLLNLNCSPTSPVSLRVNGRVIGSGRLVQIGDQIGVQITEIKQ